MLSWGKQSDAIREGILTNLHTEQIEQARKAFGIRTAVGRHLRPVKLTLIFKTTAQRHDTGIRVDTDYGEANITMKSPGCHGITYKQKNSDNPDNCDDCDNPFEAFDVVAHETSHAIEGQIGFLFGHAKHLIPDWLMDDARNFYLLHHNRGYIPFRIPTPYSYQCNEYVAFSAGKAAQDGLTLIR